MVNAYLLLLIINYDPLSKKTHKSRMKNKSTIGLYWFRRDLRLTDNPSFNQLAEQVDKLVCVYVNDQDKEIQSQLIDAQTGSFKQNFEQQSVIALASALKQKNQQLIIVDIPAIEALAELIERYAVTHVGADSHPGVNETKALKALQKACPNVRFVIGSGHTLFSVDDLPFTLQELPASFTPFKRKVERCPIAKPLDCLKILPAPAGELKHVSVTTAPSDLVRGGEAAAISQLNTYLFSTDKVKQYKQTRNQLDDWSSSSKLSFWLANGCLSVRTIYHNLKDYEAQRGANESTYWLYFELLWREYFQWYMVKHKDRLFHFNGVKQQAPNSRFDQQQFIRWCEGMTNYPIVNACMRQLNQTGYMSNRGRQLVASCFVHELNLDWRYGAAYFERQLIDYDVASNWGNWQYLAGVGADPRGHRQFDLEKQASIYDPQSAFRQKWLGSDDQ